MMNFRTVPKKKRLDSPSQLMQVEGVIGDGRMEWGDWSCGENTQTELTPAEKRRLCEKHNTATPNLARAALVKKMMLEGKTLTQIQALLRPHGRGYGARMVAQDHCALKK